MIKWQAVVYVMDERLLLAEIIRRKSSVSSGFIFDVWVNERHKKLIDSAVSLEKAKQKIQDLEKKNTKSKIWKIWKWEKVNG